MSRKQNCILRLTINIDMNDSKELMFVRAMLTRLNILHHAWKPSKYQQEVMGDEKVRWRFDAARKLAADQHAVSQQTVKHETRKRQTVVFQPPAKTKPKILRIIERPMQLVGFAPEISEVDNADDV